MFLEVLMQRKPLPADIANVFADRVMANFLPGIVPKVNGDVVGAIKVSFHGV